MCCTVCHLLLLLSRSTNTECNWRRSRCSTSIRATSDIWKMCVICLLAGLPRDLSSLNISKCVLDDDNRYDHCQAVSRRILGLCDAEYGLKAILVTSEILHKHFLPPLWRWQCNCADCGTICWWTLGLSKPSLKWRHLLKSISAGSTSVKR